MSMRLARDTFLHFLSTNLPDVTIHPLRRDPDNPSSSTMQMNAINVGFGPITAEISVSSQIVKLDVIADSELSAADMVQALWTILSAQFYTPLVDYTIPSSPVNTGSMLMWKTVRFVPVDNDAYFQYSCTMTTKFHNVLP